jgi:hypothetical protein
MWQNNEPYSCINDGFRHQLNYCQLCNVDFAPYNQTMIIPCPRNRGQSFKVWVRPSPSQIAAISQPVCPSWRLAPLRLVITHFPCLSSWGVLFGDRMSLSFIKSVFFGDRTGLSYTKCPLWRQDGSVLRNVPIGILWTLLHAFSYLQFYSYTKTYKNT